MTLVAYGLKFLKIIKKSAKSISKLQFHCPRDIRIRLRSLSMYTSDMISTKTLVVKVRYGY